MTRRAAGWLLAATLVAGCDAAEDVRVQPLPSLEAATPEARAGLPVVSGLWRFAGWELAPGDTGRVESDLPGFGALRLETQRLDSIAGFYLAGGAALPLIGEVRRDSVVALAGGGRFLAGRVTADTLWLSLTSLVEPGGWPDEARAAFVRSAVGTRFVRVKGERPLLAVADSLALDSARIAAAAADTFGRPAPVAAPRPGTPVTAPPRFGQPAQPRPGEAAPPESRTPPAQPTPADPLQQTPPQQAEEEPEPEPEAETPPRQRERPRLLGVPVDSLYSSTAARAISRPGEVSASR